LGRDSIKRTKPDVNAIRKKLQEFNNDTVALEIEIIMKEALIIIQERNIKQWFGLTGRKENRVGDTS
jgi:hypothetical protein